MNHTTYAVSYTGRRRQNEDAVYRWQAHAGTLPITAIAVADGMGGHAAGEVASIIAIEHLENAWKAFLQEKQVPAEPELRRFVRSLYVTVNEAIRSYSQGSASLDGMGTTMVSAFVLGRHALIANVGDSRAYLISPDEVIQLTRDHSVIAESLREGLITEEEALHNPYRHALTRSLDGGNEAQVEIFPEEGWMELPGPCFLIVCSDGLSGSISEDDFREHLLAEADLQRACDGLVARAYEQGSHDNISLVALEVGLVSRRAPAHARKRRKRRSAFWLTASVMVLGLSCMALWWSPLKHRLWPAAPPLLTTILVPDSLSFALPLDGREALSWRLEGDTTARPVYAVQLWIPDSARDQGYRESDPISVEDASVHLLDLFHLVKETPIPGQLVWQVRGIIQPGHPPLESSRAYLYLYRPVLPESTITNAPQ